MKTRWKNLLYPSCQSLAQQCWYRSTGLGCRRDILALPGRMNIIQQEQLFTQEHDIIYFHYSREDICRVYSVYRYFNKYCEQQKNNMHQPTSSNNSLLQTWETLYSSQTGFSL